MTTPAFSLDAVHKHKLRCPECGAAQESAVTTWGAVQGHLARVTFACGHVSVKPVKTAGRGKR